MDFVLCEKKHFYDASVHASCPQCAAEAAGMGGGGPVPPTGLVQEIGATEPVGMGGMDPIQPTEPAGYGSTGPTVPVQDPGFTPTDFVSPAAQPGGGVTPGGVQAYEPTQPVWQNGSRGFNPVTGWLVCTEGPDRGTDYRIRSGYNYIGRGQHMDICILNDSHISHDKHALIGYDSETRMFFFAPSNGRNIVRVNNKPVITSVELSPYDVLTIGTTKLCFIPLCGEKFDWTAE